MKIRNTLLALALATSPSIVFAIPITGDMTVTGVFSPTGGTSLADATTIDFSGDQFTVGAVNGDYLTYGILPGQTGTINDLTFDSFVGPFALWSIDSLLPLTPFSFTLESVTVVTQTETYLTLSGSGTVSFDGFDDTDGWWSLTAQKNGSLFSFSSGTTSTADRVTVPEPATLSLLGAGLLGMGLIRRRRRRLS